MGSNNNKWGIALTYLLSNGKIYYDIYNGTQRFSLSSTVIPNGSWCHIVALYDGDKMHLYRNGTQIKVSANFGSITIDWSDTPLAVIGKTQWYFSGLIDEVHIYNSATTITQIQSQYLAGLNNLLSNGAISKLEYNQRIKELSKEIVIE